MATGHAAASDDHRSHTRSKSPLKDLLSVIVKRAVRQVCADVN
jgi:hypothetical protein